MPRTDNRLALQRGFQLAALGRSAGALNIDRAIAFQRRISVRVNVLDK